ncbi:MAG: CHAT domain-containing protein [Bacteroidia bacterium]|nr:CHAT domain-containing protein [Bacteroidia bacterium]MDW8417659.1 CHAT domain-containing protein [Bacteroidia bacterium]
MLRLLGFWGVCVFAQVPPYFELYFAGKLDAFGKKATAAHRKLTRRQSGAEPSSLGTAIAYALHQTEIHKAGEAESALHPYKAFIEGNNALPSELRFYYFWVLARINREQGHIKASFDAINAASTFAQMPWAPAILQMERVENLLLVGNADSAANTLAALTVPVSMQEPYSGYLTHRKAYLSAVASWQQGKWDSLPPLLFRAVKSQHQALYAAEYAYLRGWASFMRGESKTLEKSLSQSIKLSKKLPNKGSDLAVRAEALRLQAYYQTSYKPKQRHKLRALNPLISELRSPKLPTSYATIQALEHVHDIASIVQRPLLSENLLSLHLANGAGIKGARLQRIASAIARLEYRGTIALSYASQSVKRLEEEINFPALEIALSQAELGEAAMVAYKYNQADSAFSIAYQTISALGEPEGPLSLPVWSSLAKYKLKAGRYNEAERLLTRQREVYKRLFRFPEKNILYLRNGLLSAEAALRLDKAATAETLLSQIDRFIRDMSGVAVPELIALEEALGDLAQLKGEFKEAEKHYIEAIRIRQKYKRGDGEVEEGAGLLRLALLYQRTGRLSRAREVYQRISSIYERSHRQDAEAAAFYTGLTEFYLAVGDYLKAESAAQTAKDVNLKLFGEVSPGYVNALLVAAKVENALGRYDKQKAHLDAALKAQRTLYEGKPSIALARTFYLLAENAFVSGKGEPAVSYLTQSGEEARKVEGSAPLEYASLALDIGGLWLAMDSVSYAEQYIGSARSVLEAQVPLKHPTRLRGYLYQARLLRAKGDYMAALRQYSRWLNMWRSIYGKKHPEYPFHLAELADLYWLARDYSSAKRSYEQSVSLILTQVDQLFNGLTENEKARYWVRVRQVLEHYYAFAFLNSKESDKLQAYEVYLTTKAFLLSETAQLRARLSASPDTAVQRAFQQWQDQKEYVARLYTYSNEELKQLNINLSQEEEELNRLEKVLTQYVGDIRLRRVLWRSVKSALPENAAAIDWIRLRLPLSRDSIVYFAVVTLPSAKKPIFLMFPNGRYLETVGAFRYSQSILNFESDTTSYRIYWSSVQSVLPNTTSKLYVSNDGIFHQVNLSTIRLPEGGYLVDKYQVIYHTRLASLAYPPKRIKYWEGRKAILIADPDYAAGLPEDSVYIPALPGTAEEAKAIRDILLSEGILPYLHTRSQADEALLYTSVSPYILHIATHGVFLPYSEGVGSALGIQSGEALANPLFRSALLLAEAGRSMIVGSNDIKRDGIANAYELLSLNLSNTELVTLSACETGLGDVQNGEGVYGLQRAFLLAGARNLIVSLWRVEDEATRDFMIHFYGEWLRKKLPMEDAFWNTQRAMRRARSAPYFWGAFLLVRP